MASFGHARSLAPGLRPTGYAPLQNPVSPDRVGRQVPWFFELIMMVQDMVLRTGRGFPGHGIRSFFHPISTQLYFDK